MFTNWKNKPIISDKLFLWPLVWSFIGLFFIFESSVIVASKRFSDPYFYLQQQFLWLVVSLILFWLVKKIPWSFWTKIAFPFFIFNLILLVLVFFPIIGVKIGGAHRWLNLGLTTFQPSELLKLTSLLYLSLWLSRHKRTFSTFLFLISLISLLRILEPDMGTLILVVTTLSLIFFIYHQEIKPFIKFSFLLTLVSLILIFISPYRRHRLLTLLNPYRDRLGSSYQLNQIIISLGRGGLFGQGLGGSKQRYLFLPASHTDAIFAVIGEETGFLGSSLLLFSYFLFLAQLFRAAEKTTLENKKLFLIGVAILISTQAIINISGMVALLPLTGITLPFISYGGSSLLTLWLLIALASTPE